MGVPVTGKIQTTDPTTDTYAVIDPIEGIDGLRSVATTTVRNAITALRRRQGMVVVVQADNSAWQLKASPWAFDDTDWTTFGGGGGTVTTVSVASANGFAGTVATATTTPAITISTSVTGLLKGNGTGVSAATGSDIPNIAESQVTGLVSDLGTLTAAIAAAGTVTTVSVATANGVSGSVATATTTPVITLTLGAITPTSVVASGSVTGSNLSGSNTGDQTITLTGAVTGSGVGSFATTLASIATHNILANTTSGTAAPAGVTLSDAIDAAIPSGQGDILYRGASAWATRAAGTTGQFLKTQGAGANPVWADLPASGVSIGGTGLTSYVLGDILYASATNVLSALAGNITTTKMYLSQTGAGASSAAPAWAQVAFADISGSVAAGQLPNPSSSTLGGVQSKAAVSHEFLTAISTSGVPSSAQPAFTDISGTATVAQGGTGLATLTNHAVLLGAATSVMGAATVGTAGRVLTDQGASADPIFSSTGIKLDTFSQVVTVDTPSAGAVTCNLATSNAHSVTLAASTLITLTNPATSRRQSAILYIIQGGSGSYTPTFTPAVAWGTAGTPVWSTAVGKVDIVILDWDGTSYRGAVVGLGY